MTNKFLFISFFVFLVCLCGKASAWNPFAPKTYEDCLLEGMKGVKTDQAANAVAAACAIKFNKDEQSSSNTRSAKVKCGNYEADRYEQAKVSFPNPNEFGQLKIVKLAWEEPYRYAGSTVFRAYLQHSFPFDIEGFYLQGYKADGKEDVSYYCQGLIGANAVGYGTCSNVQNSSKTFSVRTVVTPSVNVLDLLKRLKKC